MNWPDSFLISKDEKGVEFGCKATTLESIDFATALCATPRNSCRNRRCLIREQHDILQEIMSDRNIPIYNTILTKIKRRLT